jgi:hypothetical protein
VFEAKVRSGKSGGAWYEPGQFVFLKNVAEENTKGI